MVDTTATPVADTTSTPVAGKPQPTVEPASEPESTGKREWLQVVDLEPVSADATLADGTIVIIGSGHGKALAAELEGRGRTALVVDLPADPGPRGGELESVATELGDTPVAAIVHLGALERTGPSVDWGFLDAAQRFAASILAAAGNGGAAVLGVTSMGGAFAVTDRADDLDPWQGLVSGFTKSLAREWGQVRVRALDLDDRGPEAAAAVLADELFTADPMTDGPVIEVGRLGDRRVTLTLTAADAPSAGAEVPIGEGDVLVLTGGARGITATIARSLADRKPVLVLLGRTEPTDEDPALAGLDGADLRLALMNRRKEAGEDASLKAVNGDYDQVMRNREVAANLAGLTEAGATVEYEACDIRNQADAAAVIAEVRERHGRIDGLIHGAGIIEDKLLAAKTPESFDRVVATKAHGIMHLVEALDLDETRLVVLFGSVSGRFGNVGQTDYAAASEVLNKLGWKLAAAGVTASAINWGPWAEGGMVTPEMARQMTQLGLTLLRPEVGCAKFAEELAAWSPASVEVVIEGTPGRPAALDPAPAPDTPTPSSTPTPDSTPPPAPTGVTGDGSAKPSTLAERKAAASRPDTVAAKPTGAKESPVDETVGQERVPMAHESTAALIRTAQAVSKVGDRTEVLRSMNLDLDPYLSDHRLDGVPVVPFMTSAELIASTGALARPDLEFRGIENFVVNKGFVLHPEDDFTCDVRALAEAPRPSDDADPADGETISVDVGLDPGVFNLRSNYAATVKLGKRRDPMAPPPPLDQPRLFPFSMEKCYRDMLFHGPRFARILSVEGVNEIGISATLRATRPQGNIAGLDDDARWLIDPILCDAAMQTVIVYARTILGITPLPVRMQSMEIFGPGIATANLEQTVQIELRQAPEETGDRLIGDVYFIVDEEVRIHISGLRGFGNSALNRLASGS